jgi:hypothetical protein
LELKIKKYRKLNNCSIPPSLKNIPLALSDETFIKLYWPGAMSCCRKLFNSSKKYSDHYYKFHRPEVKIPSPPLNLSCISAIALNDIGINEVEVLSKASTSSTSTSQLVMNESESSSDIFFLDGSNDKNYTPPQPATSFRQALAAQPPSSSNDNQSSIVRKRKTLSN